MPASLAEQLHGILSPADPRSGLASGRRLLDNSSRLCATVRHLLTLGLIPTLPDAAALDLACSALQLTLRHSAPQQPRQAMTLRDRAQSAAELLISSVEPTDADEQTLLDRVARLLQQLPQRSPTAPEARLLADAVNLEDFGVIGLFTLMASVALAGDGVSHLVEACATREHYGYWDARLARFHFEPVRRMAEQRLANARECCAMLRAELAAVSS
jgi:hypothetical protein